MGLMSICITFTHDESIGTIISLGQTEAKSIISPARTETKSIISPGHYSVLITLMLDICNPNPNPNPK